MAPRAPARKQRRVVEDDDIEEGSSQPTASKNGVSVKKEKSGKGKGKARRDASDEDEPEDEPQDEEDEDGDAQMHQEIQDLVDNFTDQPIPADMSKRVRGLQLDWTVMADTFENVFVKYNHTALQLQAAQEDPEADCPDVEKLDTSLRELIDFQGDVNAHLAALSSIEKSMERGTLDSNPSEEYKRLVATKTDAYKKSTTRQKYASHEAYQAFREGIHEARKPGDPMPPLMQSIKREEGDEDEDDDDIVIGGATQDYRCPITLTLLRDPVTTRTCRHSFSKEPILSLFKTPSIKCPAQGCQAIITRQDLLPNRDLENRVKAHARREREMEEKRREEGEEIFSDDEEE